MRKIRAVITAAALALFGTGIATVAHHPSTAFACTGWQNQPLTRTPDGIVQVILVYNQCTHQAYAETLAGASDTNAAAYLYQGTTGSGSQLTSATSGSYYVLTPTVNVSCNHYFYAYGAVDHNGSRDGTNSPSSGGSYLAC